MTQQVPLVDVVRQYESLAAEIGAGLEAVMARGAFILGDEVRRFEEAYARFTGVPHCVGVGTGTDALELGLRALGIGPGDEVLVPVNSFIASALAVCRAGATPVFVDCDPEHLLIDPAAAEAALTPRTKALMPVHLYGQCAPMEPLLALAERAGLAVVEDAAQAQGARQGGRPAGSLGAVAGTSFYPGKNLGAFGDAGALLTTSAEVAARTRALRNYGSERKYHHPERGFNSRLDTLQAVVLGLKLSRLAEWNARRRQAAARYAELLADLDGVRLPGTAPGNEHVWHLYVVRVPRRDAVLASLHAAGIGAGIHYPRPMHLQGAFAELGPGPGAFPVAEAAAGEVLSLPLFPEIEPGEQERVAAALRAALAAG